MALNISRFKPSSVLLFCGMAFAVSSAWAQTEEDVTELTATALSGDVEAQSNLGIMYNLGMGVPEDKPFDK